MSENQEDSSNMQGIGNTVSQLEKVISASLRPLPTETGDGSYIAKSTDTGLAQDLRHVDLEDLKTVLEITKNATTGKPINDKGYVMERLIQVSFLLSPSRSNGRGQLLTCF